MGMVMKGRAKTRTIIQTMHEARRHRTQPPPSFVSLIAVHLIFSAGPASGTVASCTGTQLNLERREGGLWSRRSTILKSREHMVPDFAAVLEKDSWGLQQAEVVCSMAG